MKIGLFTGNEIRDEAAIFVALQQLCTSPGYIHTIAYFCWRDNLVRFEGEAVKEKDLEHLHSFDRLIGTEISTLIGLMATQELDPRVPDADTLARYVTETETLLHELHMAMQKPWAAAFRAMLGDPNKGKKFNPFATADGLREPIFCSAQSAYYFQYAELAKRKYLADADWLHHNYGFTIDEVCLVANALADLPIRKACNLRDEIKGLPPEYWSYLPAFSFKAEELQAPTVLGLAAIGRIVGAFCFRGKNSQFVSLGDFNETNAAPIVQVADGSYVLLQSYSLFEAIYDAPFYWMLKDKECCSPLRTGHGLL